MAFGIKKEEVKQWKQSIDNGEIAFLTHYWLDDRFKACNTVTKVGALNLDQLAEWGAQYELKKEWIHHRQDGYSHFDLLGERQLKILQKEGLEDHINRFNLQEK
ncbi:hypothetical protein [Jeotgalibacillus marinus]|uniref:YneQ n=1 Tax=Jeotgalibacillus marinus TaxID=86667 RepID=A0ABV3Q5Z2_9BACL